VYKFSSLVFFLLLYYFVTIMFRNFQLRVARQVLSGKSEVEAMHTEQRVVLNKLKVHGRKKNLVGSMRVGENMQQGSAGILQAVTQRGHHSGHVQTGCVEFFNVSV
jgi:hypothetical protein